MNETDSDSETATTISDTASEYDSSDAKFYKTKLCAKFEVSLAVVVKTVHMDYVCDHFTRYPLHCTDLKCLYHRFRAAGAPTKTTASSPTGRATCARSCASLATAVEISPSVCSPTPTTRKRWRMIPAPPLQVCCMLSNSGHGSDILRFLCSW